MPSASIKTSAGNVAKYADMFSAMGTEPRLRIMQLLLTAHPDGLVVGDIQAELDIPNSTLSHHLDKLKNEGLVNVRRESTFLRYTANTDALQDLAAISVCRMLYSKQGSQTEQYRSALQIERDVMSSTDIKEVVKEKYGQAALRVTSGGSSCCGATAASGLSCDPITSNLYDSSQAGQIPEEALAGFAGLRKSNRSGEIECGRNRSRSRLGRRHRCVAFSEARRAHRQGLRSRHDG